MSNITNTILAFLQDDDVEIRSISIDRLEAIVDSQWSNIADFIPLLDSYFSDPIFAERSETLAYILAKLFFYLGDYDLAISWAIKSGSKFSLYENSLFVKTLTRKIMAKYILQKKLQFLKGSVVDSDIAGVLHHVYANTLANKDYCQAISIAFESYDLPKVKEIIENDQKHLESNIRYAEFLAKSTNLPIEFRSEVEKTLMALLASHFKDDHANYVRILFKNKKHNLISRVFFEAIKKSTTNAYQMALDSFELEDQSVLNQVSRDLEVLAASDSKYLKEVINVCKLLEGKIQKPLLQLVLSEKKIVESDLLEHLVKITENDGSVTLLGVVLAHSFMCSHTNDDSFVNTHEEWTKKASLWNRFASAASLGNIYAQDVKTGNTKMSVFFPGNPNVPSIYAQGGGIYGMGLVYKNTDSEPIKNIILDNLNAHASQEVIVHGCNLALGLVASGTWNIQHYELMRDGMYSDNAIIGEAASYAIGMIMFGSNNQQVIEDLLTYSHDTQHEKIIRGISVAIALVCYGQENNALPTIEALSKEEDPILRYGAMFTIGSAYAGTADHSAMKILLKHAVSDLSDDVRRAALIALGFVFIHKPEVLVSELKVMELLSNSFNPNVRYGVALALGISSAGTSNKDVLKILDKLFNDPNYITRQGAYIAASLVFSQSNENSDKEVLKFKETLNKCVNNKDEHPIARMGGLMGCGIMNYGGKNGVISLRKAPEVTDSLGVMGMILFCQSYYWFPLANMLDLAFKPTFLIGIDSSFKIVADFHVLSQAAPSRFAPSSDAPKKVEKKEENSQKAVLSTFNRAQGRKSTVKKEESTVHEQKVENVTQQEATSEQIFNPIRVAVKQETVLEEPYQTHFSLSGKLRGFVMLESRGAGKPKYWKEEEEIKETEV